MSGVSLVAAVVGAAIFLNKYLFRMVRNKKTRGKFL